MYFKKGITHSSIIMLILSIVTFVILFGFINSSLSNIDYYNSLKECNMFISSVNKDEVYFDKLSKPTQLFDRTFSNLCPSKTVNIDKKTVNVAVDLANDCWGKFNKGEQFVGVNSVNTKLCFYCGSIKANSKIENFNIKFSDEIKNGDYGLDKVKDSNNLNTVTLDKSALPELVEEDDELRVFYTIYKDPNYRPNLLKRMGMWVGGTVSDSRGFAGVIAQLISNSNNIDTFAGVIITKNTDKELGNLDCYTYIPVKNYEN